MGMNEERSSHWALPLKILIVIFVLFLTWSFGVPLIKKAKLAPLGKDVIMTYNNPCPASKYTSEEKRAEVARQDATTYYLDFENMKIHRVVENSHDIGGKIHPALSFIKYSTLSINSADINESDIQGILKYAVHGSLGKRSVENAGGCTAETEMYLRFNTERASYKESSVYPSMVKWLTEKVE